MNEKLGRFFNGRKVLVTGGAGVIGTELIHALAESGASILCCDLKPRPRDFPGGIDYVEGDANHLDASRVSNFGPEVFFHLAATFERSIETEEFWEENYWHNIRLSHHMMTLLKDSRCLQRVVFASSYLVYDPSLYLSPTPREEPTVLREDFPINPRNVCGAAKLLHELELRFLTGFSSTRYRTISARIFRVYGKGSRDIISRWVRTLLADENAELEIYRKEGMFDYIYAGDVAKGLMLLGAEDGAGITNLGSGRSYSVAALVEILRARFPRLRTSEVEVDIPYEAHCADMTHFESLTGWRPGTNLESGVDILVEYETAAARTPTTPKGSLPEPTAVMITSASRKVPLIERTRTALAELDMRTPCWAADMDAESVTRHFADRFWTMPPLTELDPNDLADFCRFNGIGLIVPTRDGELMYFAEIRELLADAGVHVSVCSPEGVRISLDKFAFYRRCLEGGIPSIPTFISLDELTAAMPETERVVVKERFGAGSRTLGVGLDLDAARHHGVRLDQPVFQPMIEGVEHSVDLYVNRQGEVVEVVPRIRRQVHAGESVVTETVDEPELVRRSVALAALLELRGHNVLQAFVDHDRDAVFIECNPRVGGASALSMEAGLDSLRWSILEAAGVTIEPRVGKYRRGLKMVRYSCDRFMSA